MAKKQVKRGRPTVFTDEVVRKILEVAALDGSVEEMAYYAGIDKGTLYKRMEKDKDFFHDIDRLRQRPILKARMRVIEGLDESYGNAVDYLKRKRKDEFGDNLGIDHNDENIRNATDELKDIIKKARES